MIELEVKRFAETKDSTAGIITHSGKFLGWIIEDAYQKEKILGHTRIPAGRYKIAKRKEGKFYQRYSQDFGHKWVSHLTDVPGFEYILIHTGNTPDDSRGCLLINKNLHYNEATKVFYGSGSKDQYKAFYNYIESLNDNEIYITIK